MNLATLLIFGAVLLPAAALMLWSGMVMAQSEDDLRVLAGFDERVFDD